MASVIEPTAPPAANPLHPADLLKAVLRALSSLQLTVALLALSVILVFFGTLAQKTDGIWTVVEKFFHPAAFVSWVEFQHLVHFGQIFIGLPSDMKVGGRFPIPGGGLIGWLMFINLLAAHATRFKLSWKRAGVYVLHTGLLLLFVGEYVTRMYQVEQRMVIQEGDASNFTVDHRNHELAFLVPDEGDLQRVTVVPAAKLRAALANKTRISHPDLPADIGVDKYLTNSKTTPLDPSAKGDNPATDGFGLARGVQELAEVSGVDMGAGVDMPSAYVTLFKKGTDEKLGTYLVSAWLDEQPIKLGEQKLDIALRNTHYYKPFSIYLKDFRFDRYVGTQTAKNYSSEVRVLDAEKGVDRTVTIRMNEPLRYQGETYYQADFDKRTETTTVLQVVRNPGVELPYIACGMVTGGLVVHFLIGLVGFIRRTGSDTKASDRVSVMAARLLFARKPDAGPTTTVTKIIPWALLGVAVLFLGYAMVPKRAAGPLDLSEVARLPVVDGGRVKPLDSVARVGLRLISHRETFTSAEDDKTQLPAIKWYMDSASSGERDFGAAGKYPIFRIEHPDVRELLGLKTREGFRYALNEFRDKFAPFDAAARKAQAQPEKDRDLVATKVLELRRHIETYLAAWQGANTLILPPGEGAEWRSPADVRERFVQQVRAGLLPLVQELGLPADPNQWTDDQEKRVQQAFTAKVQRLAAEADPAFAAWQRVLTAYKTEDQARLDEAVAEFRKLHAAGTPGEDVTRARFETYLNDTGLFYQLDYLYLIVGILTLAGWAARAFDPGLAEAFRRAAFYVLLPTLAAHTFTLFGRMYLMDRPLVFVTNLYSSAVFIGWGVVALCLLIERLFPFGLGNFVAAVGGGGTCIIAHNLAASGDTLEMMQAVLDTNFWLATHVTTVTLGYAATYVAGLIAVVYIAAGLATPALRKPFVLGTGERAKTVETGRAIGMVLYGVVCFATLLSFVGTVLGGIWADQSWGRFWGWDPKENGAVLIVCWNALILHARWCGLVKDRGMAVLALVGNMITTWSWFGTNQLGVGLHAYGFSNKLAMGCTITWIVHLGLIGAGLLPKKLWVSFAEKE